MTTDVEPRLTNLERIVETIACAQLRNNEAIFQLTQDNADLKLEEYKAESRRESSLLSADLREVSRDMNREWGEPANCLSTVLEDIVLPKMPGILRRHFDGAGGVGGAV